MLKTSNAIIIVTTCNGCIVCVAYFMSHFLLHETKLLLCLGLFYGKCYVTIVIREFSRFSNRYLGKFLLEEIVSNHFYSSKNIGFYFCLLSLHFLNRLFFWGDLFLFILYFFCCQNDRFFWSFAIYFFFVVMKRHNRFFWKVVTFCYIPAGCSQTICVGYINYTSYLRKLGSFCSICWFIQRGCWYHGIVVCNHVEICI